MWVDCLEEDITRRGRGLFDLVRKRRKWYFKLDMGNIWMNFLASVNLMKSIYVHFGLYVAWGLLKCVSLTYIDQD